jgi:glycosyltransferase involved in cell wall biosynthesis
MRVLIINTFPIWGGDEKWTVNVGMGLKDKGHQVIIVCPKNSQTEQKAKEVGLATHPFQIGPDIAFWKIPSLMRLFKNNKIDVALCVQNRDVKIGALAAKLAGVPAVLARQGLDTVKKKIDHKIAFTKYIDGIITNTRSIKELYEGYGWFPENFIHVIYDGLTLPEHLLEIDIHNDLGLKKDSKVIIGTGRLSRQKRFDLLIKVAAKAKKQKLNWSIIIAGTGDLEVKLKQMITEYNVEDTVKLLGFRNDVLALMNASDLFVLSSDSEGMSNALREAMAVGKACVATDVFGVSELFQEGKSGIMVRRGGEDGIFQAIKSIFQDDLLKSELEKKASELIRTSFTMKSMIDQIEELFETQLAKKV